MLNEFLKERRKIEQQQATITQLKSDAAKQEATISQLKKAWEFSRRSSESKQRKSRR
jgi:predicted RNase H-like nuclease (RuvC/YqgF family)